ncbi:MAG: tRNA preQ1(34) S-adenosylmethionine ribosyltransferase-isomerase QueA [Alicyclobacillus sp.]|nr:tRNA preQ1(34) S-adenosylmethionine ribosyltransferase-isomerase QueA [Alicyclobacillus sp.]
MRVDAFDYELPEELIAQTPLPDRSASRLMVVDPVAETMVHSQFRNIAQWLVPGDVLVFNDSKVLPARLHGTKRDTGGEVELLLTHPFGETEWEAMAKPARRLREGARVVFPDGSEAEVIEERPEGLRRIRLHLAPHHGGSAEAFLDEVGEMPLPPYIHVPLEQRDRYQTVYAAETGSVAAPTAGLHFTDELLQELRDKGVELRFVTLHVGIGTFRPVKVDEVEAHQMHDEWYRVPPETADAVNRARAENRRVIAVGTTALRTLESAGRDGVLQAGPGNTDIFIYPGYAFRMIDALITNFHLPKSTLVMLVAALMGLSFTRRAYAEAVAQRYRFFSFGDSMFITRRKDPT